MRRVSHLGRWNDAAQVVLARRFRVHLMMALLLPLLLLLLRPLHSSSGRDDHRGAEVDAFEKDEAVDEDEDENEVEHLELLMAVGALDGGVNVNEVP